MPFRFKHYAHPVSSSIKSFLEISLLEFSGAIICGAMAYASAGEIAQLFYGSLVVCCVCVALSFYNIYVLVQEKKAENNN